VPYKKAGENWLCPFCSVILPYEDTVFVSFGGLSNKAPFWKQKAAFSRHGCQFLGLRLLGFQNCEETNLCLYKLPNLWCFVYSSTDGVRHHQPSYRSHFLAAVSVPEILSFILSPFGV
jgi:hypothetical protein